MKTIKRNHESIIHGTLNKLFLHPNCICGYYICTFIVFIVNMSLRPAAHIAAVVSIRESTPPTPQLIESPDQDALSLCGEQTERCGECPTCKNLLVGTKFEPTYRDLFDIFSFQYRGKAIDVNGHDVIKWKFKQFEQLKKKFESKADGLECSSRDGYFSLASFVNLNRIKLLDKKYNGDMALTDYKTFREGDWKEFGKRKPR